MCSSGAGMNPCSHDRSPPRIWILPLNGLTALCNQVRYVTPIKHFASFTFPCALYGGSAP
jgi:hypothetical protein